ncbi:MAG: hypothetical protein WC755_09055 [Candidatus Woesearchaeota archaeon]|jgi:hypothetical protein
MTTLKNKIRDNLHIYNNYELVASGHPMIVYSTAQTMRLSHWIVHVKGRNINKHASFWENGGQSFCCNRENKQQMLQEVMNFVKDLFPDLEMVKSPFGGYVPKCDLDSKKEELKRM